MTLEIPAASPRAERLKTAITTGDIDALRVQLAEDPALAEARFLDEKGVSRTTLHIATDWPGHFPRVAETIRMLVEAGAAVSPPLVTSDDGSPETPLHWAASANDVAALDALLDAGADIEAPGAVFTNGAALSDAVVFRQWNAARRLLARGARTTFWQAAGLGLVDRVEAALQRDPSPDAEQIKHAFWNACRGGQQATAALLLTHGADIDRVGPDGDSCLEAARKGGFSELAEWLEGERARQVR